eukprot:gene36936-22618_t
MDVDRGAHTACARPCVEATVLCDQPRQTMHSFGASDAWTPSLLVTRCGPAPTRASDRERVAQLLFDATSDGDGRPLGAGLSCWRFLLGAGSSRTGCVADRWRQTESFLRDDWRKHRPPGRDDVDTLLLSSAYDFTRCVGQRWFLHAAKRHGVRHLLAFVHSPPTQLTYNGKSHPDQGQHQSNLYNKETQRLNAPEFGTYITKVLQHFRERGIQFSAVTPVNEPNWRWEDDHQEGCSYANREVRRAVGYIRKALDDGKLRNVDIGIPDAGCIDYSKKKKKNHDRLVGTRQELFKAMEPARAKGIEYWVTEYTVQVPLGSDALGEKHRVPASAVTALYGHHPSAAADGGDMFDWGGIDAALWVARVIHFDLTVAGASAPPGVREGLVWVDPAEPGAFRATKTLWALAHWSFFGLMLSAFVDDARGRVAVVAVNYTKGGAMCDDS